MKRILYYTLIVLCVAACGQSASQEENTSAEYKMKSVTRSDILLEETYPASIEGRQSIRIIPRVEGYLQEIKVKEGQRVKKDQVLFILDQAEKELDPQRYMRVNRQFIVNAAAVEKLSNWFLGKMRVHLKGHPDTEIIVSKEKATSVKKWLDS